MPLLSEDACVISIEVSEVLVSELKLGLWLQLGRGEGGRVHEELRRNHQCLMFFTSLQPALKNSFTHPPRDTWDGSPACACVPKPSWAQSGTTIPKACISASIQLRNHARKRGGGGGMDGVREGLLSFRKIFCSNRFQVGAGASVSECILVQ